MRQTLTKTSKLVGALFAVIAVANYYELFLQQGFTGILGKFLASYRAAVDFILEPFSPYLKSAVTSLANWLHVKLQLYPHWKYVMVPASLYFANDARTNWEMGRHSFAISGAIWGLLVALAISVSAGTFKPDDPNLLALVIPIAGFIIFAIGNAVLNTSILGFPGQSWWKTFFFFFKTRVATNMIIGVVVLILAVHARGHGLEGANVFFLIVYVTLVALRDILVSVWVTMTQPRPSDVTALARMSSLGSWKLGTTVLLIVAAAAFVIIVN